MPELDWTLQSVADHLGGRLVGSGDGRIERVTIDSRDVRRGDLFVAIAGERFDGHRFVVDAVEAGASAVIVEPGRTDTTPRIEVPETKEALLRLAARRRDELTMPVVAITGSTGKTTTKDLIHAGIPGSWASKRSFNNEIGVPLTVLSTPDDASVLILEVGSRGRGHITWLADAVRPNVAVITNLGVVHMETFGTREGLANSKFELVEMLAPEGIAVLPIDEPRLDRGGDHDVVTFGSEASADVVVADVALADDGTARFTASIGDWSAAVQLSVAGLHQASNAAAALGVAQALGLNLDRFAHGMAEATGSDWRMQIHHGDITVVNDAYNANPQSVASALATVSGMGSRAVAVLGPMAELGPLCEQEHRRMGEYAAELGFAALIVVGVDHGYALGAHDLVLKASGTEEAADTLRSIVQQGDIVLVKASRSAGLEQLALQLSKDFAP